MQAENNKKNVLILPDIHHRIEEAERIIRHVGADEIIFVGDYFDDFGDDVEMVRETSAWLCNSVAKPNRIHLWGNHDIHYAYAYRNFKCSGYEDWKYWIIQEHVDNKVWDHLKWYHFLDGKFLLTHAGLHKLNVPDDILKLHTDREAFNAAIATFLDAEKIQAFNQVANGQRHWFCNAGFSRGGTQRVGGIIWCDYEREFHPIQGLNQIFGHTPQGLGIPKWCTWDGKKHVSYHPINLWKPTTYDNVNQSINICLDVHRNTHWAIWNGKTLEFGNVIDDL